MASRENFFSKIAVENDASEGLPGDLEQHDSRGIITGLPVLLPLAKMEDCRILEILKNLSLKSPLLEYRCKPIRRSEAVVLTDFDRSRVGARCSHIRDLIHILSFLGGKRGGLVLRFAQVSCISRLTHMADSFKDNGFDYVGFAVNVSYAQSVLFGERIADICIVAIEPALVLATLAAGDIQDSGKDCIQKLTPPGLYGGVFIWRLQISQSLGQLTAQLEVMSRNIRQNSS
ncbi:hypothetical protein SprV_0301335400 [Sparganum proliferum]